MRRTDETGSALFTVMIAAALGLVIVVTLTRLTSATGLLAKSAQLEGDVDRLERQIQGTIADAKSCPTMFKTAADAAVTLNLAAVLPAPVAVVDRLYSGFSAGGRRIANLDTSGTSSGLVVTAMDLREQYKLANLTSGLSNWELALRLMIEKKLTGTTALPGASVIIKKFRISATINANNQIVACAPLGSRTALGPMSPLRATVALTAENCSTDAEKDTLCAATPAMTPAARTGLPANPTQYFAATRGDLLAFGMMRSTAGTVTLPALVNGFGVYGLNNPHYGAGGASSWALYHRYNPSDGQCNVMCIHKEAPIRFTRTGINANTATSGAGGKDAKCKTDIGPKYVAATFNDLAQAGWSTTGTPPTGAPVEAFPATIGNYGGQVDFDADAVGAARVLYYTGGASGSPFPLACVRRAQH